MDFTFLALKLYLFLIAVLLLAYSLGKILRLLFQRFISINSFFADTFFSTLLGIIVMVFFHSIILSGGQTVNLFFIPIGCFFLYELWNKKETSVPPVNISYAPAKNFWGTNLAILLLGSLVAFGWEAWFALSPSGFPFSMSGSDTAFYTRISYALLKTGQESIYNVDTLQGVAPGITLYHYFELWLNSLLIWLFDLPGLVLFLVNTNPVFYFITFLGIMALIESTTEVRLWHGLLAMALLFVTDVKLEVYKDFEKLRYIDNLSGSLLEALSKKNGTFFIIAIGVMLLVRYDRYLQALLLLLCLPVMTITGLPAITGGVLLTVFVLWIAKLYTPRQLMRPVLALIVTVTSIYLFYKVFGNKSGSITPDKALGSIFKFESGELTTRFNLVVGTLLQFGLVYFPYLLVLAVSSKLVMQRFGRQSIVAISFICGITLAGVLAWAVFFKAEETIQLFTFPSFGFMDCLLVYLFITHTDFTRLQLNPGSISTGLSFLLLAGILAYNIPNRFYVRQCYGYTTEHSNSYREKVNRLVQENKLGWGGSLIARQDYTTLDHSRKTQPLMMRLGNYLSAMRNEAVPVPLSDFDIPDDPMIRRQYIGFLPFTKFVNQQKQAGEFVSIEKSQVDFIERHNIRYLIISKNVVLTDMLNSRVGEVVTDSQSGEKFILLK